METRNKEHVPVAKTVTKTPPILGRLGLLRDRIMYGDAFPVAWDEWKQMIIDNREGGIPEELAPKRFRVSKSMLDTFQEMLPVVYPGRIASAIHSEAAYKARKGLEVARSLVYDPSGNRLLVHKHDVGESELTETGSRVWHEKVNGEIGVMHTHALSNNLPSSSDILPLLLYSDITGLVITPSRVIAYFRTDKTPTYTNHLIAKGHLEGMGKTKERRPAKSGTWTLNYSDLNELHIAAYEAERGSNVFSRKDHAA